MIFRETPLAGCFMVEPERIEDERGFFARTWCAQEFAAHGLNASLAQCSVSYNQRRGTLRGMHFQASPHGEDKLVRCTAAAVYDVVVDLRPESATRTHWFGIELSAGNRCMLYVPRGFAHGFLTLTDGAEVFYQISQCYVPEAARGVRWNDPAFAIRWPAEPEVISRRDQQYPDFVA